MDPIKILHTADWHIGTFPCPAVKNKANLRFLDICAYIEFLISKARDLQPDVIIIAGDIFNQAKTWSDRGLFETETIINYLTELSTISPVFALRGTWSHDGKTHYDLLTTALANNNNIKIIDEACVINFKHLASIAFVPVVDRSTYQDEMDNLSDKTLESNFLSNKVRDMILDLKKEADKLGLPSILVTHYTVLGAALPDNKMSIFADNEPTIDPLTLVQANYDLVCLGHIHKPQQLESYDKAFYSGSLCALNFSDEYDPHGFYMHYLSDTLSSEFIETPCRKFKTLLFDDNALNDIIAKDYDMSGYVDESLAGYIVRVIYNCTDVTNKKLNKAVMEKVLYNTAKVFYVQEIVPQNIDITVDKTSLKNSASIADNLIAYLENEKNNNHTVTDKQITDIMAIAQPIIDEINANASHNKNVGVFTPIEIEVKNYRNYKSAVFNYSNVKFCVINGENGAGKSSLFMDAIIDVLFEDTREGDITGWICNDVNIRSGSIKLTFSIGDNTYYVIRTRQKSGKATLDLAMLADNGKWISLNGDKMKDTQENINNLIGMDPLTLKSCGLIMQDAYGLFLQADKTVRIDILSKILGLDIYSELYNAAGEFNQVCSRQINNIISEENNILSNMKNGQDIQDKLNEAYIAGADYAKKVKECSDELINNTLQRENAAKTIENYNRLCDEISALNTKKKNLQIETEKQNNIIIDAELIVCQKPKLEEMTVKLNSLTAIDQEMTQKEAELHRLMDARKRLENDIAINDNVISDADTKIQTIEKQLQAVNVDIADIESNGAKADLYAKTKQEIADTETKLAEIQSLKDTVNSKMSELADVRIRIANRDAAFNAKMTEIDNKAALINDSNCPIVEKATCKFLLDARQAVSEKNDIQANYDKENKADTDIQKILETDIVAMNNKIAALSENLPDLQAKKDELAIYENYAFKTAGIEELKKTQAAYTQQLNDFIAIKTESENKKSVIITDYDANTKAISAITAQIADHDSIKSQIAAIGDLNALSNEIAKNEAIMAAAENRIKELNTEIQNLDFDLFDKIREHRQINLDNVKIAEIDANILACRTRQDLLNKNIEENGKIIGQLEQDMKKYNDDIAQLDRLKKLKDQSAYIASNAEWLKKAFNRNGIPHNIIRSIIPVFETTASNILGQMSNNTMSIELQTEKVLTTKKEIATLDIIVCDTQTGNLPYLSRSGGERVKAALSIVLALAEIKASESGTQLGFLFIDEPPFLDSNGVEAYCDALIAIQRRYADLKIMAITHDVEMRSRFPQSIEVVRTPNGSEVVSML